VIKHTGKSGTASMQEIMNAIKYGRLDC
jgi:hypothetical protein